MQPFLDTLLRRRDQSLVDLARMLPHHGGPILHRRLHFRLHSPHFRLVAVCVVAGLPKQNRRPVEDGNGYRLVVQDLEVASENEKI